MNLAWSSLTAFLAMGGYGVYVWGSFGVTLLVGAVELASLRARRRALSTAHRADSADFEYGGSPHEA